MTSAELAGRYIGGLTHLHTRVSNHPGHLEGDLTVSLIIRELREAGLADAPGAPIGYLAFNEHTSDSARPHRLGPGLRELRLLKQATRYEPRHDLPVLWGLEVSALPDGNLDAGRRLTGRRPLVIASRHALPRETEHDAEAITRLFKRLCDNPRVAVLGHPMRHIEGVAAVDWPAVLSYAAGTGTAVEVNFNTFLQASDQSRAEFWQPWLRALGRSRAAVTIGFDLHTCGQLSELISYWKGLDALDDNPLRKLLTSLQDARIPYARVISSDYGRLVRWLMAPKSSRQF